MIPGQFSVPYAITAPDYQSPDNWVVCDLVTGAWVRASRVPTTECDILPSWGVSVVNYDASPGIIRTGTDGTEDRP